MIKKGFTIIEILMVVGLIGILATVVLVSVGTIRGKAQDSKAKNDLETAQKEAASCLADGETIASPNVADPICNNHQNWPDLTKAGRGTGTADWNYVSETTNIEANGFTFAGSNGDITFTCTQSGCS